MLGIATHVLVLLGSLPLAAQVDFSTVPPPGAFPAGYKLRVVVEAASKVELDLTINVTKDGTPESVQATVVAYLEQRQWEIREVGQTVSVVGHKGSPVRLVRFTSVAPTPLVDWIVLPKK